MVKLTKYLKKLIKRYSYNSSGNLLLLLFLSTKCHVLNKVTKKILIINLDLVIIFSFAAKMDKPRLYLGLSIIMSVVQ